MPPESSPSRRRLPAPAVVEPSPPFPLVPVLAPIVGAVALWAATGSASSWWLAVAGPALALASVLDGRWRLHRRRRRADAERRAALAALRSELDTARLEEVRRRELDRPDARAVLAGRAGPPWALARPPRVVIGRGTTDSGLRLDGEPANAEERALADLAATLDDAPVTADLAAGIGVLGPDGPVRAFARAVLVQAAQAAAPDAVRFLGAADRGPWRMLALLPHRGPAVVRLVDRLGAARIGRPEAGGAVLALAADDAALPPGLGTVVRIDSPSSAVVLRGSDGVLGAFRPALASEAEATAWAGGLAERARAAGFAGGGGLPALVPFGALHPGMAVHGADTAAAGGRGPVPASPAADGPPHGDRDDRAGLPATIGVGEAGPVVVDLVADGPHALVAGTSGSGKSAFLVAWVAAMAAARSPERVSFLLVDFKGGAAFAALAGLPHVVGVITDLDGDAAAERALLSLRAELGRREAVLRAAGVAEIGSLPASRRGDDDLARLVVVVDEYQALIDRHRELGQLVTDLTARGRSLGIHVVLATQRPLGVVRDAILANCGLRVCLRVLAAADSSALVGVPDAAELPAERPGRAVLDPGTGAAAVLQTAFVGPGDLQRIARADAGARRPRRPWLDPLPPDVPVARIAELAGAPGEAVAGIPFGVGDDPERQRRTVASWDPVRDGALLVLGAPGSGRSTALAAVVAGAAGRPVVRLGGPGSAVWDALDRLREPRLHAAPPLVVVDDLDRLADRWSGEARAVLLERLLELLRGAPAQRLAVCASASRLTGAFARFADEFGEVLRLRPAEPDERFAGVAPRRSAPPRDAPPGAGRWRGLAVQVGRPDRGLPPPRPADAPVFRPEPGAVHLVASPAPAATLERWRRAHPGFPARLLAAVPGPDAEPPRPGEALIGDAEAWSLNWTAVARHRESAVVVACAPAELRALVRGVDGAPLLDPGGEQCWVLRPGARIARERWAEGTAERAAGPIGAG